MGDSGFVRVVLRFGVFFGRSGKTARFSRKPYSRIHRRNVCGQDLRFDIPLDGFSLRQISSPPKRHDARPKDGTKVWVRCGRDAGNGGN